MNWYDWDPGAVAEDLSVEMILNTLPPAPIEEIPKIVRLLENPNSPYHLAGPSGLYEHDIIHVLLGRGLLQQDEAFVIGYTIGNSRDCTALDRLLFMDAATSLYKKPFQFQQSDALVFDLAFDLGMQAPIRDIHLLSSTEVRTMKLSEARTLYGVEKCRMRQAFEQETVLNPNTKASQRLVTNLRRQDDN